MNDDVRDRIMTCYLGRKVWNCMCAGTYFHVVLQIVSSGHSMAPICARNMYEFSCIECR